MTSALNRPQKPVRIGVIGCGKMGVNHLCKYATFDQVELVGVYDIKAALAKQQAQMFGITAYDKLEDLIKNVDAVSICSDSTTHADIGQHCMEAGLHCLIEKPLATTFEDCAALIGAAGRNQVWLLAGHIERFNPAVLTLSEHLRNSGETLRAIDSHRLNPASRRITDVDVVLDLMIHDIDIIISLTEGNVSFMGATTVAPDKAREHVTALFQLTNGQQIATATLTASRMSKEQLRTLSVITDRAQYDLDYREQTIKRRELGRHRSHEITQMHVPNQGDALANELSHFIEIIHNDTQPLVSGRDGQSVVDLVLQVNSHLGTI